MIAYLNGKIIDKRESALVVNVQGVGYEVHCSSKTHLLLGSVGSPVELFVHTQYRSDGAALFGFISAQEKNLFLELIKVDSVGPKSALNILSSANWIDLVHLIEEGDVSSLSKLPKVSKKTAEHLVVKLKGKLQALLLEPVQNDAEISETITLRRQKVSGARKLRLEAQSALTHLGYKPHEIERSLAEIKQEIWDTDLQSIIKSALNDLSGNI